MQRIVSEELKLTASESLAVEALITELGRAQEKHPTYDTLAGAYRILEGGIEKFEAEFAQPKRCDPCVARRLIQIATIALRAVVDLNLPVKYAPTVKPAVPISVADGINLTTEDLDRIRESFAQSGRATVVRPNGTKAHFLGAPTGIFDTKADDAAKVARGPMHHAEDEVGFGQPYDSHGG
jgi:hypothetical protein